MEWSKLLDWVKLPTKTLAGLCIVFAILIFLDGNTLDKFGLKFFVDQYRPYLGVGFLVSFALTFVNSIAAIGKFIYPWIAQAYWIRNGKKRLRNLPPIEKKILGYYIQNQTRSQKLSASDGIVIALQKEKIIGRASPNGYDYIIQPWAWKYLNNKPQLLK